MLVPSLRETCNVAEAIPDDRLGNCPTILASGARCKLACDRGYVSNGFSHCSDGSFTIATCELAGRALAQHCTTNFAVLAHGGAGDCPVTLAAGVSCQPVCEYGYELKGGILLCNDEGELSVVTCEPRVPQHCNSISHIITANMMGDCPEMLEHQASCRVACAEGYEMLERTRCLDGKLSVPECQPESCNASVPPKDGNLGNCTEELSSGSICEPECDENFTLAMNSSCLLGKLSPGTCMPSNTTTTTSTEDKLPPPCQDGAQLISSEGVLPIVFLRVPADTVRELVGCRPPEPCNFTDWIDGSDLTGPEVHKVQLGTCVDVDVMQSGDMCNLVCMGKTSPRLNDNLFHAVDLRVQCNDGRLVDTPQQGTWCSGSAWETPPLIFLGTVCVATVLAALLMERRQNAFEKACVHSLLMDFPSVPTSHRHLLHDPFSWLR